jgi:thiol-disulfide isomerase/thioredoxin
MAFSLTNYLKNYFKKKKPFTIVTDILFIVFIILLIIPGTRKEVSSRLIRLTALPPSELSSESQFKISEEARKWQLYDMEGNMVTLNELMDQPVFLNFWATWCPPCIGELPGIQDLYGTYKDKVRFVLVTNEQPGKVNKFAAEHDYGGLPFYIGRGTPHDFYSESIPTTFVIAKDGTVIVSKKGAARWNSGRMEKILDELLQK